GQHACRRQGRAHHFFKRHWAGKASTIILPSGDLLGASYRSLKTTNASSPALASPPRPILIWATVSTPAGSGRSVWTHASPAAAKAERPAPTEGALRVSSMQASRPASGGSFTCALATPSIASPLSPGWICSGARVAGIENVPNTPSTVRVPLLAPSKVKVS